MEFGKLIKNKREKLGLSIKDVACLSDISDRTIYNIEEDGREGVNIETVRKLKNALDLTRKELAEALF